MRSNILVDDSPNPLGGKKIALPLLSKIGSEQETHRIRLA
jgi:hypothetical protein